jgi:hypothetical protein
MNEPSKEARLEQQRQRVEAKLTLIDEVWKRSEWVLNILRTKQSSRQPVTPEEKLQWAKALRIV